MMILLQRRQLDVSGAAEIPFLPRSNWAHLKFELHHPSPPHPCTVAKVRFIRDLFLQSRSILKQLVQSVWGACVTKCYQLTQALHA